MRRSRGRRLVIEPVESHGDLWLAGLGILLPLLPASGLLTDTSTAAEQATLTVTVLAMAGIFTLPALLLAAGARAMRYELDEEALTLRCPPFLLYRIPVRDIVRISQADLEITMWSALRLPGLALFSVRYAGVGKVRMCARRATQGILLVQTRSGRFGLTPSDPEGLVHEIRRRQLG